MREVAHKPWVGWAIGCFLSASGCSRELWERSTVPLCNGAEKDKAHGSDAGGDGRASSCMAPALPLLGPHFREAPSTLSPPWLPCSLFGYLTKSTSHIWKEKERRPPPPQGHTYKVSFIGLGILAHLTCHTPEFDRIQASLIQHRFHSSFL